MESEAVQESWNMATATMQRLNNLLIQSSMFAQMGDLISWFKVIMDLRRNLFPFIEPDDFKIIDDKLKSLPANWNSSFKIKGKDYAIVNKIFDEIYMKFMETMKSKGLLMPKSRDARKAIIGG